MNSLSIVLRQLVPVGQHGLAQGALGLGVGAGLGLPGQLKFRHNYFRNSKSEIFS